MSNWHPGVYDFQAAREHVTKIVNGREVTRVHHRKIPHVGELIACPDRKAYRVTAIEEREQANWHEQTMKAWEAAGKPDPYTWEDRERAMRLRPADNPTAKPYGYGLYPWHPHDRWWPLREQYPVCNDCGLIWPCPCDERTTEARAAMRELDRLGGIMPGCCWACGEPITARHRSVEFEGENLLMPGTAPAVFHAAHSRKAAHGTCRSEAEAYEAKWVTAAPGRQVRLRCAGLLYRHLHESECTRADDCPGVDATHAKHSYCTSISYESWSDDGGAVEHPRPLTNCGERGCRGPKVPSDISTMEVSS